MHLRVILKEGLFHAARYLRIPGFGPSRNLLSYSI